MNPIHRIIQRHLLRHSHNCKFGRRIRRRIGMRDESLPRRQQTPTPITPVRSKTHQHTRHINNPPPRPLPPRILPPRFLHQHLPQHILTTQPSPPTINPHLRIKIPRLEFMRAFTHLIPLVRLQGDPGEITQNVDAAREGHGGGDEVLDGGLGGYVHLDEGGGGGAVGVVEVVGEGGGVQVGADDAGALGGEELGGGFS